VSNEGQFLFFFFAYLCILFPLFFFSLPSGANTQTFPVFQTETSVAPSVREDVREEVETVNDGPLPQYQLDKRLQ